VVVADMLSQAELDVVEFNVSPKMVRLVQSQVKGLFTISDMLSYDPDCQFAAIFIIFCYLRLLFADFSDAAYEFASALQPRGILRQVTPVTATSMQWSRHKVLRISCIENTKLERKGERNASTFSSALPASSLPPCVLHCTMLVVETRANPHKITRMNDRKEVVRSWVLSLRRLKLIEIRE
jgi:hypothetical protein